MNLLVCEALSSFHLVVSKGTQSNQIKVVRPFQSRYISNQINQGHSALSIRSVARYLSIQFISINQANSIRSVARYLFIQFNSNESKGRSTLSITSYATVRRCIPRDKEQGHTEKKRMTVFETLSEMKDEGPRIEKTTTFDTLFPRTTSVIVRPDRTTFEWSIQCSQL